MIFKRFVRATIVTGAVAVLAMTGVGTASASAKHCGSKYCINVKGSGLHVEFAEVSLKSGKNITGYAFVRATKGSSRLYYWTDVKQRNVTGPIVLVYETTFRDGTVLCGGVAPTRADLNYAGEGCITVHK